MECAGTDTVRCWHVGLLEKLMLIAPRVMPDSVSQRAEGHVALGVNSSPIDTYRVCNPPYLPSLWRDLCMPIFSLTSFILIYKIILSFTS